MQTSARGCGNSGVTYLTVSLRDEAGSEWGDTKVNPTAIAVRTKGIQEPACRSEQTEPTPAAGSSYPVTSILHRLKERVV